MCHATPPPTDMPPPTEHDTPMMHHPLFLPRYMAMAGSSEVPSPSLVPFSWRIATKSGRSQVHVVGLTPDPPDPGPETSTSHKERPDRLWDPRLLPLWPCHHMMFTWWVLRWYHGVGSALWGHVVVVVVTPLAIWPPPPQELQSHDHVTWRLGALGLHAQSAYTCFCPSVVIATKTERNWKFGLKGQDIYFAATAEKGGGVTCQRSTLINSLNPPSFACIWNPSATNFTWKEILSVNFWMIRCAMCPIKLIYCWGMDSIYPKLLDSVPEPQPRLYLCLSLWGRAWLRPVHTVLLGSVFGWSKLSPLMKIACTHWWFGEERQSSQAAWTSPERTGLSSQQ